jgi:rubredoxin
MEHKCLLCDYVYDEEKGDPEHGIPPGTKWEDVDKDFLCPDCGASKLDFD